MDIIRRDSGALPEDIVEVVEAHKYKRNFIQLIRKHFGSYADRELIYAAYDYHAGLFSGVNRKSGGSYMNSHLVPVAIIMITIIGSRDPNDVVASIGHDSIEDKKYVTYELFSKMFTPQSAYLVRGATKPPLNGRDKRSLEYCEDVIASVVSHGPECVVLKNDADRLHNIVTLWGTTEQKKYKIWETERFFLPAGSELGIESPELRRAIRHQRTVLHIDDSL